MTTTLWIVQALTAVTFFYSGICKSSFSERKLIAAGQTGVEGLPLPLIRSIGILEILGAIGLVLPALLQQHTIVTAISATGFCIIMVLAARIHYRRHEIKTVLGNIVLFILSLVIAIAWL